MFGTRKNSWIYLCKKIEAEDTKNLEGFIDGLYVEEEYRNKGIATDLINIAKSWAKENNIKSLYLNVLIENKEALTLYLKADFEEYSKKLKCEIE